MVRCAVGAIGGGGAMRTEWLRRRGDGVSRWEPKTFGRRGGLRRRLRGGTALPVLLGLLLTGTGCTPAAQPGAGTRAIATGAPTPAGGPTSTATTRGSSSAERSVGGSGATLDPVQHHRPDRAIRSVRDLGWHIDGVEFQFHVGPDPAQRSSTVVDGRQRHSAGPAGRRRFVGGAVRAGPPQAVHRSHRSAHRVVALAAGGVTGMGCQWHPDLPDRGGRRSRVPAAPSR